MSWLIYSSELVFLQEDPVFLVLCDTLCQGIVFIIIINSLQNTYFQMGSVECVNKQACLRIRWSSNRQVQNLMCCLNYENVLENTAPFAFQSEMSLITS